MSVYIWQIPLMHVAKKENVILDRHKSIKLIDSAFYSLTLRCQVEKLRWNARVQNARRYISPHESDER